MLLSKILFIVRKLWYPQRLQISILTYQKIVGPVHSECKCSFGDDGDSWFLAKNKRACIRKSTKAKICESIEARSVKTLFMTFNKHLVPVSSKR